MAGFGQVVGTCGADDAAIKNQYFHVVMSI
jgi:hypothetical protein